MTLAARRLSFVLCVAMGIARSASAESGESFSEDPTASSLTGWGLVVYDQRNQFVNTHLAESEGVLVGSSPAADLVLSGLSRRHALVTRVGHQIFVDPIDGPVRVDGQRIASSIEVTPQQKLGLRRYQLSIFFLDEEAHPDEEGLVPAHDPWEAAELAEVGRAPEFDKRTYGFCHDPDFGEDGVIGADFCVILDESTMDVCPEAAEQCAQWTELPTRITFGRGSRRSEGMRTAERRRRFEFGPIPVWIRWLLLGALLVGAIAVFAYLLYGAGWEREDTHLEIDVALSDAAKNLQALPDTRAQVLLRMARQRLQAESYADCAILLHLALLRHLDDEGIVRYHPSKTNGEYVRSLRRDRELGTLFRQVSFQTERIRFGDGRVEPERVSALLTEVDHHLSMPRSPGAIETSNPSGVATIGALLAAFVGASAVGCGGSDNPLQPFYSHGPAGMSALLPVMEAAGLPATLSRKRLIDIPEETRVVVLRTSAAGQSYWPAELKLDGLLDRSMQVVVLDDHGKAGHFLPVTSTVAHAKDPKSVSLQLRLGDASSWCTQPFLRVANLFDGGDIRVPDGRLLLRDPDRNKAAGSAYHLSVAPLITVAGSPSSPEEREPTVAFVAHRQAGDDNLPGCLYVFSDRDLFTNASLTRPANARWIGAFFAALQGSATGDIVFAERLDHYGVSAGAAEEADGDAGPSRALRASNLLPLLIHVFIVLALFYVAIGAAFGPLRDPERLTHKAFIEHVEAVGRQYARSGTRGLTHSAISLAKFLVTLQRDKVRGGAEQGWNARAAELAEKHRLPVEDVKAALRLGIEGKSELGAPTPNDPAPSSERMLKTLSRLLRTATARPPQEKKPWS